MEQKRSVNKYREYCQGYECMSNGDLNQALEHFESHLNDDSNDQVAMKIHDMCEEALKRDEEPSGGTEGLVPRFSQTYVDSIWQDYH
jgi:hypothetical protein